MHKNQVRGFTLIELLVVIAIIGVLSAVVLASLNTARSKGNDAAIKSNLSTILTQSAIYYDTNSNYGTNAAAAGVSLAACATANSMFVLDTNVKGAISQADIAAGGTGAATPTKVLCSIQATGSNMNWLVYAPLSNGSTAGFCVDSSGNSRGSAAPSGAVYVCP